VMQDLWNSIVSEHGQVLDDRSTMPREDWVGGGWARREEGRPSLRDKNLSTFP
jgi:hypothetical protein